MPCPAKCLSFIKVVNWCIVTQSLKKLCKEEKEWALNPKNFKRLSDNNTMDITTLSEEDADSLFYKEEPYTPKNIHQRLIITYTKKQRKIQMILLDLFQKQVI